MQVSERKKHFDDSYIVHCGTLMFYDKAQNDVVPLRT